MFSIWFHACSPQLWLKRFQCLCLWFKILIFLYHLLFVFPCLLEYLCSKTYQITNYNIVLLTISPWMLSKDPNFSNFSIILSVTQALFCFLVPLTFLEQFWVLWAIAIKYIFQRCNWQILCAPVKLHFLTWNADIFS